MSNSIKKTRSKSESRVNSNLTSNNSIIKSKKSIAQLNKEYIEYCVNLSHDKKYIKLRETEKNRMLKRCKICKDFKNEKYFLFCIYCQDAYHSYCINSKRKNIPKNRECIICPRCKEEKKKSNLLINYKQLKINDVFSKRKNSKSPFNKNIYFEKKDKKCFKCNKTLDEKESSCQCEKCGNFFHQKCFSIENPNSKILCQSCEILINNTLKSTKINDFFKSTKKYLSLKRDNSKSIDKKLESMIREDFNIYITITKEIYNTRKIAIFNDGKMKLPKQLNSIQKEKMKKSLFRALEVKNILFSDDLVYIDKDCPESMNNSLLEPDIKEIAYYNKEIYYKFKERSRKGEYPPVEIIDDPIQRFIVKAIDDISMNTLICEYTGEVTLLRKKIFDRNDSIMELIRTPSSDTSLVICPEKYGNLARFISGVNNFKEELKKKQNVNSLRMSIDGTVHILLIAKRNIKKGEILYYDYNAGGYNQYPTYDFV